MRIPKPVIVALIVIAILIQVGIVVVLRPYYGEYRALPYDEHVALYESPDNGWHQIEEALHIIEIPDDDLSEKFKAVRESGEFSEAMNTFLDEQRDAIALAKAGLEKDTAIVPRIPLLTEGIEEDILRMRTLTEVMTWDGVRLEFRGNSAEAAQRHLDAMQIGDWTMRGGDLNECLIGTVTQVIAARELHKALPSFNAELLSHVITKLHRLEKEAVPFEQIKANDWVSYSELPGLYMVLRPFAPYIWAPDYDRARVSFNFGRAHLTGTRLRAMVILHEKATGEPPATLAEVVAPDPVPIDLTTGNPFEFDSDGKITSTGTRFENAEPLYF